jgi:hypothetical protein
MRRMLSAVVIGVALANVGTLPVMAQSSCDHMVTVRHVDAGYHKVLLVRREVTGYCNPRPNPVNLYSTIRLLTRPINCPLPSAARQPIPRRSNLLNLLPLTRTASLQHPINESH